MTTLLLIAGASVALVLAFRKRPLVWLAIAVMLLVFVPRVASRMWLSGAGELADVHPAAFVLIAGTAVTLLSPRSRRLTTGRKSGLVLALVLWCALGLALALLIWGGVPTFARLFIIPAMAFISTVVATQRLDSRLPARLARLVLVLAAAQATLSILQWLTSSSLVYQSAFATQYWWRPNLSRALGTLDSPLDLAAFLTMSLPLIALVRHTSTATGLALLLSAGVFVTGSRVGILVAAAVLIWVLLTHSRNPLVGLLMSLLLAIAGVLFLSSDLADRLLDRFGSRGDVSTGVRTDALAEGVGLLAPNPWLGSGTGYAYQYSQGQLQSSFENGYLASAIDHGVIIVVALLAIQCVAVLSAGRAAVVRRLPGALAILWGFAYSSFTTGSSFGSLGWLFIALSMLLVSNERGLAGTAVQSDGEPTKSGAIRVG